MPPRQRRILHLAERTDARRAPARQLRGDFIRFFLRRGDADRRNFSANFIRPLQRRRQIRHGLDVNKPVQARHLKPGVGLINHRPGRGILAAPMPRRLRRMGGAHLVNPAARRDGRRVFRRQFAARLGLLAPFQFIREQFREIAPATPRRRLRRK